MSIYICEMCNEHKDEDYNVPEEWGQGLICEDCYTEVAAAYDVETGKDPDVDGPRRVWEWAKDAY